jgi:hypothetical protein
MAVTGSVGIDGISATSFTAAYKNAIQCAIASSVSTEDYQVACSRVNVTGVQDTARRRELRYQVNRQTSASPITVQFQLRLLIERLGLSPSNAASSITTKLANAQSGGSLTATVNDVLEYNLGSAYTPLTVTTMVTNQIVVMNVVTSAPPTMAPTAQKHNNGGGDSASTDDGAIAGGVIGALAGVGLIAVAAYIYMRQGGGKISPSG